MSPFHRRVAEAFGSTGTASDGAGIGTGDGAGVDRDGFLIERFEGADGRVEPLADNLMMACGLDGMAGNARAAIILAVRLWKERRLASS